MSEWEPGRWWRVVYTTDEGRAGLWCETSNRAEAEKAVQSAPGGGTLQRLYKREQSEWRDS